jgi:hypothetical protein
MLILRSLRRRLFIAMALVLGFAAAGRAYAGGFEDCLIDDWRCGGGGCYIWATGCAWCDEDPSECKITFASGTCSEVGCSSGCNGNCVVINPEQ